MSHQPRNPGLSRQGVRTAEQIARRIAHRVVNQGAEHKYHDKQSSTTADFNGLIVDVSAVAQGDTDITRDGDKLMPTSLEVGFNLIGETYSGICRLVVFRWKEASIPLVSEIFQGSGGAYATIQPFDHDERSRFEVLADKRYSVSNNGGTEIVTTRFRLKLAKKRIEFIGGSTTGRNKIYVIMISDRSLVTSPGTFLMTRLNYTDM